MAIVVAAVLFGLNPVEPAATILFPYREAQSDGAEARFERGLQLAQAGELPAAEQELRAAVKLRASDPGYLTSLATGLAIEKKIEEPRVLYKRAQKTRRSDGRSRGDLSENLWKLRRYAEARRHLNFVLQEPPADAQAKLLLGLVSEKTGDDATAIAML